LVNTGATISLGLTLAIMSQVIPLSSLEAILTGQTTGGGTNVAGDFLTAVHVVFLFSAVMVTIALLLVLRRWRSQRLGRSAHVLETSDPA
jgi:hypothetical protein